MLVYNDTKRQFVSDVKGGFIEDKINACIRQKGLNAGHDKEYESWHNSMQFMRNIVEPENACQLATRLQAQVKSAFEGTVLDGQVSLSIGIALSPEHGLRFVDLFSAADAALYQVKRHGRGAYKVSGTE